LILLAFYCNVTAGKTVGQYRQLLQQLKRNVQQATGRRLTPQRMVVDFERSLILAVETEFPRCRISGCYFHFTQSLWRHIQQVGLAREYRRNLDLKRVIRLVMALAFLPVLLVRQNFLLLCNRRSTRRLIRRYPQLQDWLDYVWATYVANNAAFPVPTWNVHDRNVDTRTNNHVEGDSNLV